ncbi:hypothetical protein ACIPSE_46130 [Streptomyces sp. NPDC090106]|uniref:hypothetical protein n=1 Tax=Streptomyces sp. NPDC090106 TaxID=3365946 RepID=UPI00381ED9ED
MAEGHRKAGVTHSRTGQREQAEASYREGLAATRHPDYPASAASSMVAASFLRELAVPRGHSGTRNEERYLCTQALDRLTEPEDSEQAEIRMHTRYALADLFYDEGLLRQAFAAEKENFSEVEAAVHRGVLDEERLADAAYQVALDATDSGDLAGAVEAGDTTVRIYRRLTEAGLGTTQPAVPRDWA